MATNQAFCAIGVIAGYAVGAVIVDLPAEYNYLDWRMGFLIQAVALGFVATGFMAFDNSKLDIFGDRMPEVPMNVEIRSVNSRTTTRTRKDVAIEKFGSSLPWVDFWQLL